MRTIRWSDNDQSWGPFTYSHDRHGYRPIAISLKSDRGKDEDFGERFNTLRFSAFGHTLLIGLPRVIKPAREWHEIRTEPTRGQMIAAGRLPGYWECWSREYGISIVEGAVHLHYGQQTHSSDTDKSKVWFMPWTQLRHVRHSFYGLKGEHVATIPDTGKPYRLDPGRFDRERAIADATPTASFAFDDFDGERIMVTTRIEEREWHRGTKWCRWLSLFCKPLIKRSLDLRFSKETGKRKGSWKGGTLGHGIDMLPGELHEAAFRRYCAENRMTFVGAESCTKTD